MTGTTPRVIVIPPKPELARSKAVQRQLRVAAYCRVSSSQDEQLHSLAAQISHYTQVLSGDESCQFVGIYADRGIAGADRQNQKEFKRMLTACKQGGIDIIIVRSVSRFARNTVDCLEAVRMLKACGVGVIFEKEGISTFEKSGEVVLSMCCEFARKESGTITRNLIYPVWRRS